MHPVHKPAAEGISKHCSGAKETKNNGTIWFLCETVVRAAGDVCTLAHIFPSFCHFGRRHSGFKAEIKSFAESSFFCKKVPYCTSRYLKHLAYDVTENLQVNRAAFLWQQAADLELRLGNLFVTRHKHVFVLWYLLNSGKWLKEGVWSSSLDPQLLRTDIPLESELCSYSFHKIESEHNKICQMLLGAKNDVSKSAYKELAYWVC